MTSLGPHPAVVAGRVGGATGAVVGRAEEERVGQAQDGGQFRKVGRQQLLDQGGKEGGKGSTKAGSMALT